MTDLNLLMFGCVVTSIAIGGAYIYLREAFMAQQALVQPPEEQVESSAHHVKEPA